MVPGEIMREPIHCPQMTKMTAVNYVDSKDTATQTMPSGHNMVGKNATALS